MMMTMMAVTAMMMMMTDEDRQAMMMMLTDGDDDDAETAMTMAMLMMMTATKKSTPRQSNHCCATARGRPPLLRDRQGQVTSFQTSAPDAPDPPRRMADLVDEDRQLYVRIVDVERSAQLLAVIVHLHEGDSCSLSDRKRRGARGSRALPEHRRLAIVVLEERVDLMPLQPHPGISLREPPARRPLLHELGRPECRVSDVDALRRWHPALREQPHLPVVLPADVLQEVGDGI